MWEIDIEIEYGGRSSLVLVREFAVLSLAESSDDRVRGGKTGEQRNVVRCVVDHAQDNH